MFNKFYEKLKGFMSENWKFFVSLLVIVCLFTFELPYVVYTPGGSIDLANRIEVEDGYETQGSLSMAYVSMIKGSIPFLLFSYLIPNWDIVSTKDIKPDNESLEEMILADQISLIQAQNNALYAAFSLANKEVKVLSQTNHLVYMSNEADTDLELFDEILTMNGQEIKNLDTVREMVGSLHAGDEVSFEIIRRGKKMTKNATVYETSEGPKVGVSITTTYEYETNPKVSFVSKSSESGPSGGLMNALAIYNALVSEDITMGKKIIGTGTIDRNGVVGEIGGVKYKLLGAAKKKADVFLVPTKNYEEAIQVKNENDLDIRVIAVSSLEEAIAALAKL